MADRSYRISLTFALLLHLVIVTLLVIKFTPTQHNYVLNANIVKAVAISQTDLNKQAATLNRQKLEQERIQEEQERLKTQQEQAKQRAQEEQAAKVAAAKQAQVNAEQQALLKQQAAKLEAVRQAQLKAEQQALRKQEAAKALKKHLLAEQNKELADIKKQVTTRKTKALQKNSLAMQQDMAQQLAAEREQLGAAQNSQLQGEVDKYKAMIIQAISSRWIVPDGVDKNATCQILVNVAPGGVVLSVQLVNSSGNMLLDRSAQTAVLKASPLPVPEDTTLFNEFRVIKLIVRPEGIVSN